MQNWFFRQTGSRLRIRPDIKVVSLNETDEQIATHGEFVRDRIETLLREMGFDHPFTMYAACTPEPATMRAAAGPGLTAWHRLPTNKRPDIWPRCTFGAPSEMCTARPTNSRQTV
jgi:hypothetical protein